MFCENCDFKQRVKCAKENLFTECFRNDFKFRVPCKKNYFPDTQSILVCKECFSVFDGSNSDKRPCCPEMYLIPMPEAYNILRNLYFKVLKEYIAIKFK